MTRAGDDAERSDEEERRTAQVCAVVVTHRRPDELAKSLDALSTQSRLVDQLIVVDNDADDRVRDLVAGQPIPTTYLPSRRNLGGAGGFALGILHALALGADWVWLADDDGHPQDSQGLATLLACADKHRLAEVSPMVCDADDPQRLAFPLRRGLVWRRLVSELRTEAGQELLPGIASLFNGALFRASTFESIGVPDLRLFVRGDEVEMHRRLVRSGLALGTCLKWAYLHPGGAAEFKPILGGRMHTQYPDDATKRYFTYRNRGYLMAQPGLRKLLVQEWLRFGWFFLISRRDPKGLLEWLRLRRLGRREQFGRPGGASCLSLTLRRSRRRLPAPERIWSTAITAANCGCIWVGRTSSSGTAARCSDRSGARARAAAARSRWA